MFFNTVVKSFILWRIIILLAVVFAPFLFALQQHHLGGGMESYLKHPIFWSMANFDGEHYISIAAHGYLPLQYFFFPAYPLLISIFSFSNTLFGLTLAAQLISNLLFLLALIGLNRLIQLDFSKTIAYKTILILLVFPTSFFFAAVYTESIFLCLIVWSIYFARRGNWLLAGVLAGVSSASRVIGVLLLTVLIFEWIEQKIEKRKIYQLALCLLSLTGIAFYTYYLYLQTGDPLHFQKNLEIYGAQRSSNIVLLPQVVYRYIFKVIPSMNWLYFEGAFSLLLEIITATVFIALSILSIFKLRRSYAFYLIAGFVIPTLSGSFSSMPRYVLVLFPGFILLALGLSKLSRKLQLAIVVILGLLLAIATSLFSRGFWIA